MHCPPGYLQLETRQSLPLSKPLSTSAKFPDVSSRWDLHPKRTPVGKSGQVFFFLVRWLNVGRACMYGHSMKRSGPVSGAERESETIMLGGEWKWNNMASHDAIEPTQQQVALATWKKKIIKVPTSLSRRKATLQYWSNRRASKSFQVYINEAWRGCTVAHLLRYECILRSKSFKYSLIITCNNHPKSQASPEACPYGMKLYSKRIE